MTITLSHRPATLPSAGPSPSLTVHVVVRDDASPRLFEALRLALFASASEFLERARARFMTDRVQGIAELGCVVASLPEIRAEISAELHAELDIVELETSAMMWAGLTPGLTWAEVSDRGSRYLALGSVLAAAGAESDDDREDLAHLSRLALALTEALLRGWAARVARTEAAR